MVSKRIAVIGAGVGGLPAIKCCIEEGLEPVCFELRDDVGGLWNYSDVVVKGRSSVMKSTTTNVSKVETIISVNLAALVEEIPPLCFQISLFHKITKLYCLSVI